MKRSNVVNCPFTSAKHCRLTVKLFMTNISKLTNNNNIKDIYHVVGGATVSRHVGYESRTSLSKSRIKGIYSEFQSNSKEQTLSTSDIGTS